MQHPFDFICTDAEADTCRRMRNVVTEKKLRDIARSQAAEIEMLESELDRLHMRTYPSFVDSKTYYPDERTSSV